MAFKAPSTMSVVAVSLLTMSNIFTIIATQKSLPHRDMEQHDTLNIIIDLCKPFKTDGLASIFLTESEMKAVCTTICQNGCSGWCVGNINKFYKDNSSLVALAAMLRPNALGSLVNNQRNLALFQKIESMLASHGIELIALKGLAVAATLYSDMSQRTIGDIDVLVHHDNIYKAHRLIRSELGGVIREHERRTNILSETLRTHLNPMTLDGQIIELHFNLYSQDSLRAPNVDIFQHICCNKIKTLDATMMLYHLLSHLIKNRHDKGIRINWIVDIVQLLTSYDGDVCCLCDDALEMNSHYRQTMLWAMLHICSLLPEEKRLRIEEHYNSPTTSIDASFLAKIGGSTKGGIHQRLKTFKHLIVEITRQTFSQRGLKNKCRHFADICYDLYHRNH